MKERRRTQEDKVVIVTGGGQGLGEALCKRMSDEGVKVAVVDINLENAKKVAATLEENILKIFT